MTIPRESLLSFVISTLFGACLSAQTITEFPLPSGKNPNQIVAGPDGALWFTASVADVITETTTDAVVGRMTTDGFFTEFSLPRSSGTPEGIASGPDGNLWFTQSELSTALFFLIGRITTAGVITEFPTTFPTWRPYDITAGPDGNLWFTEAAPSPANRIGRISTTGTLTEFSLPVDSEVLRGGFPIRITVGRDGNLWYTKYGYKIGRITTSGVITEFPVSKPTYGITAGADGNIWFTEQTYERSTGEPASAAIGRITPDGVITEFPIPTPSSVPRDITEGPDGNLWFTETAANQIGRITPAGVITEFPLPTPGSYPSGITVGPDGNVWFTDLSGKKIGRLTVARAPAIDSRILPVVGSTVGVGGSYFRTAVQLYNATESSMAGRIVFHRAGASGVSSDPTLAYSLSPGQTQSIADLLPSLGRFGLGSADIEVTSGALPVVTARVFNDAGSAGTTGFTEQPMRTEEALRPGSSGVLLLPADLTRFRFNLGVRTLTAGTAMTLTLRDAAGAVVTTVARVYPATYHEQQSAGVFLGVTALPPGGSVTVTVNAGAAILYGATVDNTTGDPSLQIAAPAP